MMLSAEEKRWIVVGIALQVTARVLRNCIKQEMDKHYINLDAYCNGLTTPCTLKTLTHHLVDADATLKKLKFQNVNNNLHVHGNNRKLYTYSINSSVDLAKLYLPDHLAQFSAFDDSLDMTAILHLLGFNNYKPAAIFSPLTQTSADDVRKNVRNKWGHVDFSEWSEAFFNDCFDKLETLVRRMGLTAGVEKSTLDQLNDWQTKGCQLCMGHAVDQNLLLLVQQAVEEVIKKYKNIETKQTSIQASLTELQTTAAALKDQQSSTFEAVQQWQEQQKKNKEILERLESVQKTLNEELLIRVKRVEENLAGVVKRMDHLEQGPFSPKRGRSRSTETGAGSRASDSSKQVHHNPEAYPEKPFDVETCRSKLAMHYKRTAKAPTSVWSSVCQVELDQIYTRLSWVKKEQTPAGPSQSELTRYSDLFTTNEKGFVPKRILVQGQTGIGKSTFVKKLTVDWAELDDAKVTAKQKDALGSFQLVVAVNLKEVSSCQTLKEVISRSHLFPEDEEISTDLLSYVQNHQEEVLLVFDGYDEYRTGSKAQAKYGSRLSSPIYKIFHRDYLRGCTVLVTSRPSGADELQCSADKHAEITGFDIKDQAAFMRKMLDSESQVDQLLRFLKEKHMEDLARVPLLNLFFCLLWKLEEGKLMELIQTKTKLYRAIIRHFLQYGHKRHSPDQVSIVKEENYDEILNEIGKVALKSLLKGSQVFKYGQVSEKLRGEKSVIVGLVQFSECGASLEPMEVVSFIHKSIQEYLAAWYITNKCVSADNLGEIEEQARTLEDCEALENVFPFICGLSNEGAVKVFKHLSTVRVSDPSVDLSKMIPDEESETYVPPCEITERHERFNDLVLNCVREVSSEVELVKHWFDCTGGIVLLNEPLDPEVLSKADVLIQAAHSWAFLFDDVSTSRFGDEKSATNRFYQSVKFFNLLHIPLKIAGSSDVLKLGDFLTTFLSPECGRCNISFILCCPDGQIQCYITRLWLVCDAHINVFTEAAAKISNQSLTANLCSNQSCLKFLTSVTLENDKSMKDIGAILRYCKHLQRIKLHGGNGVCACDLLEQVPNPEPCYLEIGDFVGGHFCTLTSSEAERFAVLLPRFPNISTFHLDLGDCCAEAVIKLVTSITLITLKHLKLKKISFTPAAAAAFGRTLPKMTSLETLHLTGKYRSILHAEEMKALFGGFNKTFRLKILLFKHFRVRGNLAPLIEIFRFFPNLRKLNLVKLDMDGGDLRLLLSRFQFIRNLEVLNLNGNPLGHAVTSIVPHLPILPELRLLNIENINCSEEDFNYVRVTAKQIQPLVTVNGLLL